jgi:SAM-dependent methyltransferase
MADDAGGAALDLLSGCRRYARWLYDLAEPHLGSRVVEAGAGIGTQSAFLVAGRPDRTVLLTDADAERVRALDARFSDGARVSCARWVLPEPFARDRFVPDTFVLWNVLEHVADDVAALRRMREALPPGGRVVVFSPAGRWLASRFDRGIGHFRRYARGALARTAREAGLDPVIERTVNVVGALGWFASVKLRGAPRLPAGGARLFERIVPLVRLWEDRLPVPFGLSVLLVASKAGR